MTAPADRIDGDFYWVRASGGLDWEPARWRDGRFQFVEGSGLGNDLVLAVGPRLQRPGARPRRVLSRGAKP